MHGKLVGNFRVHGHKFRGITTSILALLYDWMRIPERVLPVWDTFNIDWNRKKGWIKLGYRTRADKLAIELISDREYQYPCGEGVRAKGSGEYGFKRAYR